MFLFLAVVFAASWILYFATGRAWIVSCAHGIIVTVTACLAILLDSEELGLYSITLSTAYFAYDAFCDMIFGEQSLIFLIHHILGVSAGYLVCWWGPDVWRTYAFLQTNECSTPFLYMAQKLDMKWAYVPFVLLFLLSRVMMNFKVICLDFMPVSWHKEGPLNTFFLLNATAYYAVQLFWFASVLRMSYRKLTGKKKVQIQKD